ncbi:hypothetical protein HO173_011267 [Letharia columbiana]|uniref:Uncharacterized protein n=1 Tax=Letharia columbiana TaxID=112416 RepID=A0A8H6FJK6_9LECA|nr:uncharacterized protein HO173_011267 [Letharia columbiana]KAF6229751.1 hypothetical protein HO173_011267 [Letharia columbiana]
MEDMPHSALHQRFGPLPQQAQSTTPLKQAAKQEQEREKQCAKGKVAKKSEAINSNDRDKTGLRSIFRQGIAMQIGQEASLRLRNASLLVSFT